MEASNSVPSPIFPSGFALFPARSRYLELKLQQSHERMDWAPADEILRRTVSEMRLVIELAISFEIHLQFE